MPARFTRKDFLEALFDDYLKRYHGFVMVQSVRRMEHKWSTRYYPTVESLAKEPYAEDQHVYFGVCPREKMKQGREHIRYVVALWAGLDIGSDGFSGKKNFLGGPAQAAKAIRSFPLEPSIIVESGVGVHLYWILKRPHEVSSPSEAARVETILSRVNQYFQCRTPVPMESILRLPGTTNPKGMGHPRKCTIKFVSSVFRHELEDFEGLNIDVRTVKPETDAARAKAAADKAASQPSVAVSGATPVSGGAAPVSETGEMDSDEVEIFLAEDESRSEIPSREAEGGGGDAQFEVEGEGLEVVTELSSEEFAEQVADRVIAKLKESVVEDIVEKVVQRLRKA